MSVGKGTFSKTPGTLHLFNKRYTDVVQHLPTKYRKPEVTRGKIEAAATAAATWDNSDPFAYGRTALHVKQGYLDPEKVVEETHKRTIARRVARERDTKEEEIHVTENA
jgi:hypothetical protein